LHSNRVRRACEGLVYQTLTAPAKSLPSLHVSVVGPSARLRLARLSLQPPVRRRWNAERSNLVNTDVKIAVIGTGNIGGTIARKWGAAGHQIIFGARDPSKNEVQVAVSEIGGNARAGSTADAIKDANVVLFAVPGAAMDDTVTSLGAALNGKVVVDATNNIGVPVANSVAVIQAAAPQASVYRAFNIYGFENFAEPVLGGIQADLFYCGTDGPTREQAEQLIRDVGLNPIWLGGPDKAELVDQLLRLWFTLAFEQKKGRRMALKPLMG
jgi:predicted dinucleotide-binding enzyme